MVANKQERANLQEAIRLIDDHRLLDWENTMDLSRAKVLIQQVLDGKFVQSYHPRFRRRDR